MSSFSIVVSKDTPSGKFRLDFIPSTLGTSVNSVISTVSFDNIYNMYVAVVVRIGDYGRLYLNGVPFTTTYVITKSMVCYGSDKTVTVGDLPLTVNSNFVGSVNELRIYPLALPASDVAVHYAAGPNTLPQMSGASSYLPCAAGQYYSKTTGRLLHQSIISYVQPKFIFYLLLLCTGFRKLPGMQCW